MSSDAGNVKIFLDDIRDPKECVAYMYHRVGIHNPLYLQPWIVVRSYSEFVKKITECLESGMMISHVSLDHDLADEHYDAVVGDYNSLYDTFREKTGLDCARWLKAFYGEKNIPLPTIWIHSQNPVGVQNIINVFK